MMTALALVQATPAFAAAPVAPTPADTAADAPPPKPGDSEEIVVTGSRVARSGYSAPTPLTVVSQADIQNSSPTNNIADFINELPQLAGSTRPANSRQSISSGTAGLNTVNLRNLGETRTLVLIDGRRSPGSEVTGVVDINTIPQALVKNVEIVTGGASAAYGSDAVAGVINFILDKKFTGIKASIDSGMTGAGDDFQYSATATVGFGFAGGRGHMLLNGEWAHRDGIFQADRDWNGLGLRMIQNPAYTAANGQPYYLVRYNTGTNNEMPGGIINSGTLKGTYFGANGAVNHYNYGSIATASLSTGGDWHVADDARRLGLDASEDRRGVFGRVSYEATPWMEVYAEASYNWQSTLFNSGPQVINITLKPDNAYLMNAVGAAAIAGQSFSFGTTAANLPYRENNNTRSVQRYTLGAGGDFHMFGKKAVWSAYVQYGQADTHELLVNIMNNGNIALAEDAVFAPAGNALGVAAGTIVCRSSLTNPANGCTPLNLIGTGGTSQTSINYVLGNPYRDQKLEQLTAGINLSATPFATWAGDVSVAVGGEYRREEVSGYVPTQYQSGWAVGNFLPTFGSYDVKEAYVETVVPLGAGIEINGAARATDYSTSGYVTTWKAGATWQPIPDVRFRVTQSRDIRAPNLSELYNTGTSRTNFLTDPYNGQQENFLEHTLGNQNLQPEKADSTTAGIVLTPRFLRGFTFSADWFQTRVKDAIYSYAAQDIINLCYDGLTQYCSAYRPNPTRATKWEFFTGPFNAASLKVAGIDFDASYRLPIGRKGILTFHGLATHYLHNITNSGIPGTPVVDTTGANGGNTPSWIYRASIAYDLPGWDITLVGRGISAGTISNSYVQCSSNCPAYNASFPTVDNNSASGSFYVDLNVTAKIGQSFLGKTEFFANVTNLFDRDPILIPAGTTGVEANQTYSDMIGRTFRIGVRIQTK